MKKLIAIACLFCMGYAAQAQTTGSPSLDTLVNAGTVVMDQPSTTYFNNNMSGTWSVVGQATKIDGTTAGFIILQASIDGTNFLPLTGTSADSVALSNSSGLQMKQWFISNKRVVKARVVYVGSGTQNTQVKTWWAKGD